MPDPSHDSPITAALSTLGVRRLSLGIHQAAFPAGPADAGIGAPNSPAGRDFLRFAAQLGFNALQLGPDGHVSLENPSPYDGTAFARATATVDWSALGTDACGGLLDAAELEAILAEAPGTAGTTDTVQLDRALHVARHAIGRAHAALQRRGDDPSLADLRARLSAFVAAEDDWLSQDALFEVLSERIGHDDPTRFEPAVAAMLQPGPDGQARRAMMRATLGADLQRVQLGQWLAERDGQALRATANRLGMALYGDLQVGWSHRDRFLRSDAFDTRFALGAPPSRTNPDGQPWGYPLLSPDQLDDPDSPARRLLRRRLQRAFAAYDGLRIDHPHGLVCPWVYERDAPDALKAVQDGTRAFESPDWEDPVLQRWAIARREDLDPGVARHADGWVTRADDAQVARWSRLIDEVVALAGDAGGTALSMEVLSTCPAPLRWVLQRHGLGRYRVTQKADVTRDGDVYRTDVAQRADWVMLGNHDTPSIWTRAQQWAAAGEAEPRARYLAQRLWPEPERSEAIRTLCVDPGALAQAMLADLFACDAEHVLVYFVDLLGETEPYNRPGIVDPRNWRMRVPTNVAQTYAERCQQRQALDVAGALARALRARGGSADLVRALDAVHP